ncbi:MAG TPA: hypothetical protein VMH90_04335, partial [Thermoplasmata archaeon]|nr:hypothetical protein [Thermoplasmata archaeon]
MNPKRVARILQAIVLAFLVAALVSEALLYLPPLQAKVEASVAWTPLGNGSWSGTVHVDSTFAGDFSTVALERPTAARSDRIYFYFDANYPISFSDLPDWFGLSQHLVSVALARGLPMDLQVVNTSQMVRILEDPTTTGSTVVFASGILPAPIFSPTQDLIGPWMRAGGLVIWAGDQIGAYSGSPHATFGCGMNDTLGQAGTARLINVSWLENFGSWCPPSQFYNLILFENTTALGLSFDVVYPYTLPGRSFAITKLETGGGLALGGIWENTTNVAYLPEGQGGLLDFASPVSDPIRLSISIDNLWESGTLYRNARIVDEHPFSLVAGGSSQYVANFPPPVAGFTPCLFTVQTDYPAPFAAI